MQKGQTENANAQSDTSFQGYTNYVTGCVALWLMNDPESDQHWCEQTCSIVREASSLDNVIAGVWTEQQGARFALSDQVKQEVQDGLPLADASLYSDLLQYALDDVDWSEIASGFIQNFCD